MKIKIKKLHKSAVIPKYSKNGDGCVDLYAVERIDDEFGNTIFDTGLALEIPENYVGLVFPRSSICKTVHQMRNGVGVIDSGYRGSIKMAFWGAPSHKTSYKPGDRIGQLMIIPYPKIDFEEVEELNSTNRGTGGFGSTGE